MSDRSTSIKLQDEGGSIINPSTADNQVNGLQKTQVTDGTNTVSVIEIDGDYGFATMAIGAISSDNSSITPLGISGVFTGVGEDLKNFGTIVVAVFTDVPSVTDGLSIQFSSDNINWDGAIQFNIFSNFARSFTIQAAARYYRIVYTNGTTAQTVFRLQVQLKQGYVKPSTLRISDPIFGDDDAELVKSVLTGLSPNSSFVNVKASVDGSLKVKLTEPLSAFGDLRTIELSPIFQGSFEYTVSNTDINCNTVVNGGTVTQADAMGVLTTSTTTASTALLQSERHAKYRPGLGGLSRFTGLFTAPVSGTEQYIGLMDEVGSSAAFSNGFGLGYNGTDFIVARWQNDTLFSITQENWDDPLDGTGRSGVTIDFTKINVFEIQFQYLGAGAIKYCIEDAVTGDFFVFHTIQYANANIVPSVYNPNFHFTIWVNNGGTTDNLIMKCASYAFFVEGFTNHKEIHQPQNGTGEHTQTGVTTETAILTIRNKLLYASKNNFIDIFMENVSASIEAASANNLGSVSIVIDATLGGTPSWTDINTSNSVVEYDISGTTVTGGKTLLSIPLAGKNDKAIIDLNPYRILLSEAQTLTVAGSSANDATINASLLWKELF